MPHQRRARRITRRRPRPELSRQLHCWYFLATTPDGSTYRCSSTGALVSHLGVAHCWGAAPAAHTAARSSAEGMLTRCNHAESEAWVGGVMDVDKW
jgi:hypothetical protein